MTDDTNCRHFERAKQLIGTVESAATSSLVPLVDQHPLFASIKPDDWDYFSIAAALFMSINGLALELPDNPKVFQEIMKLLEPDLQSWSSDYMRVLNDCRQFVKANVSKDFPYEIAVGNWVMLNLFPPNPSEDAINLSPMVGKLVFSWTARFWK